jgi:nicotinamide-nucleotide amidase
MAKNSKKLFSTTYSLSITGFAGPRKKLESTGIVYFGLANKNNIKTVKQQISGKTRQEIRVNSCVFGLNFIKNNLLI